MARRLSVFLVLLALAAARAEEPAEVGSVLGRGERVVLSVWGHDAEARVRVVFPPLQEYQDLTLEQWQKFKGYYRTAARRLERLQPEEASYVGKVGRLHVGCDYPRAGRFPGKNVVIYLVLEDNRNQGIHLDDDGRRDIEELMRKVDARLGVAEDE
ncbi:MAG TPA: hypothetical protein VNO81_13420 [Candidatus Nitrosotenuis sp.]|jgi:hypothetical protein|nr:hypothetical protein [Candidatus Nitrosotenuis sp.]